MLVSHEDRPNGMITIPPDSKMRVIHRQIQFDAKRKDNQPKKTKKHERKKHKCIFNVVPIKEATEDQKALRRAREIYVDGKITNAVKFRDKIEMSDKYFRHNVASFSEFMINDYRIENIYVEEIENKPKFLVNVIDINGVIALEGARTYIAAEFLGVTTSYINQLAKKPNQVCRGYTIEEYRTTGKETKQNQ